MAATFVQLYKIHASFFVALPSDPLATTRVESNHRRLYKILFALGPSMANLNFSHVSKRQVGMVPVVIAQRADDRWNLREI